MHSTQIGLKRLHVPSNQALAFAFTDITTADNQDGRDPHAVSEI